VEWCKSQGIPHPRFVWYDWPESVTTTDPKQADVYVVRQRLYGLTNKMIESLPYYKGDARHRHVFFGLGPDGPKAFRDLSCFPGVFFRACVNRNMLKSDPDIIAWPWPVEDLGGYGALPPSGFKYDAGFQGHVGRTQVTIISVEKSNLRSHIVDLYGFFSTIRRENPDDGARLRKSYLEAMQVSRIALCRNSNQWGSIRYRFYEAMSMGRVNLFIGDNCVLPLSDRIDWQNCIIQIADRDAHRTGEILEQWLSKHDDAEIIAMGLHAQKAWTTWLKRENWGIIIGKLIRERLEV